MLSKLEFDPITLAYECLHRGGADFSELELNKLARAVIAQDAEIQAARRDAEVGDRQRLDFAIGQAANTIKDNTASQIADWLDRRTEEVGHNGEAFLAHWSELIRRGAWK